ncbi:MAG: ABC transporter substrate-binding protein, partial [Chloroflexi bacterium]|nr:ABC transporter substrate-binding protein [Chloroflexota bacterium]
MLKSLTQISWRWLLVGALVALLGLAAACGDDDDDATPTDAPADNGEPTEAPDPGASLKIGALLSFTGGLSDFGEPIFNGVELAVNEINEAGGVNGQDVELVRGDTGTNPDQGATEAQRLVDIEGVQGIVGALSSGVTIRIAEQVTGPAGVVQISPASTSPAVTDANDSDFLFRTTISDAAQGLLLANLADDAGYGTVCNIFVNNAYGEGLSDAFTSAFENLDGTINAAVPHEEAQVTYLAELGQCEGADALAAIAYPESAGIFLREAVEGDLFENYVFVDGTKSTAMFDELGWAAFDGALGTAPAALPTDSESGFVERYEAAYGDLPQLPFIKEAYDAVYVIALAAEAAGSTDRTAIRDEIRNVANDPGTVIDPGPEGFAAAITALAAGDDINYEGVTGPLEFDSAGDPAVGAIEWFHV